MHTWALGLSCETPAAPPDRAAGARTRQPENSKRAHFRAPALQTPPKFHARTPRERKKKENCGGGGKKKREILGPPPFGAPPFGAPLFLGLGLHPLGPPPFGASTLGAPLFLGLGLHPRGLHPWGAPPFVIQKFNIQKLAEIEIGRSRNWPKSTEVEIGRSRTRKKKLAEVEIGRSRSRSYLAVFEFSSCF